MAVLAGVDVIDPVYLVMVILFVIALWRMSHPSTARSGILWAGAGVLIAVLITFLTPGLGNLGLIGVGIAIGGLASAPKITLSSTPPLPPAPRAVTRPLPVT